MKVQFTVYKNAAPGKELTVEIPEGLIWYEAREQAMRLADRQIMGDQQGLMEMGAGRMWRSIDREGNVYTFHPHWPEGLR